MGFTTAQLEAIEAAIASGELSVAFEGKRIEYRSIADLTAARNLVRTDLAARGLLAAPAGVARGSTTFTSFSRD